MTPVRERGDAHALFDSGWVSLLGTTPCGAAALTSPQKIEQSLPSPPLCKSPSSPGHARGLMQVVTFAFCSSDPFLYLEVLYEVRHRGPCVLLPKPRGRPLDCFALSCTQGEHQVLGHLAWRLE